MRFEITIGEAQQEQGIIDMPAGKFQNAAVDLDEMCVELGPNGSGRGIISVVNRNDSNSSVLRTMPNTELAEWFQRFQLGDTTIVENLQHCSKNTGRIYIYEPCSLPDPWTVLSLCKEKMPAWLANYQSGDPFPRNDFFKSRIVYYPGSKTDGQPLHMFGGAHAAHCFVYCDNFLSADGVLGQLSVENHPGHPRGYRLLGESVKVPENILTPHGWTSHLHLNMEQIDWLCGMQPTGGVFALWTVLERTEEYSDDHGPKRISILHVGGDGYATFDALFCQKNSRLPYAILLQDHGYGGARESLNLTFGGRGCLWELASTSRKKLPEWLLVADDMTKPWPGYIMASAPDIGGMYNQERCLWRRELRMRVDYNTRMVQKPIGKRTPASQIPFQEIRTCFDIFRQEIDIESPETAVRDWATADDPESHIVQVLYAIIVTFGEGHRIWAKYSTHYENNRANVNAIFTRAYNARDLPAEQVRGILKDIPGLGGMSYGTKVLRFINPSFVVLDTLLQEEYGISAEDYQEFNDNCSRIAEDLGIRPVDVESALFAYMQIHNPNQRKQRWRRYKNAPDRQGV